MSAFLTIYLTSLNEQFNLCQIPRHSASMDFTTLIGLMALLFGILYFKLRERLAPA
jgi:hypothetical protein